MKRLFGRGGRSDAPRGSVVLIVWELGPRADEAIACLRIRVEPLDLEVMRLDPRLVVVRDPLRRTERELQAIVAGHLDACDPAWRDFAAFRKGRGGSQHITGSER